MQIRKLRKWNMYGIIYTVHAPLCSIHFLISLIDKKSPFPMLYNPTFLYTFVFSISWLLNPAMYAYKYRLAFLSETNRWLSINYQTKKVCQKGRISIITISYSKSFLFLLHTTSPYFRVPQLYTKPWNGKPQQLWNQPKGGYNA